MLHTPGQLLEVIRQAFQNLDAVLQARDHHRVGAERSGEGQPNIDLGWRMPEHNVGMNAWLPVESALVWKLKAQGRRRLKIKVFAKQFSHRFAEKPPIEREEWLACVVELLADRIQFR